MNMSKKELFDILSKNPALKCRELDKLKNVDGSDDKHNKFNAKPGWLDGHYFPSQTEMKRYCELKILKAAGEIKDFKCQPKFELQAGLTYRPDFMVEYWGHVEYEEVKGKWTVDARMRVKLFREKYPDLIIKIIRNGVVTNG